MSTPTSNLVSTTPSANNLNFAVPKPITGNASVMKGLVPTNPFLGQTQSTGGSTTPSFSPTQGGGIAGAFSSGTGLSGFDNTTPTATGFSNNGGKITATTQNSQPFNPASAPGYVNPASVSSVAPTGNAPAPTGNAPVPPVVPPNNTSADTYNNGVNGNGQSFPGYVSALGTTASGPSQNYTQANNTSSQAQTGLINTVPQNNANVQQAQGDIKNLQDEYAKQTGLVGNSPIGLSEQGGEQGLLNSQYSSKLSNAQGELTNALTGNTQNQTAYNEAGGLANAAAVNATSQQGMQQSGEAAAAGLSAPQNANALGTYNPLNPTQYTGYGGGSTGTGATGAGIVQGQVAAGQQYAQNSAILGKVNAQLPALNQAISAANFNPSSVTGINQITQWGQGNLSNSSIPEIQGSLNDIVSSLSAVLGVPSSGTSDFRTQFAGQIVNQLQSGKNIEDAIQFAVQQAEAGNQGYLNGAQNANGTTGNTNSGYSGWGATK